MQERRSEVRLLCADMVEVTWKDQGRSRHATAILEDISASGACLQLETAVPYGVVIRWECPNQNFVGRVRYCTYREIGFFVGVEFEGGTRWSKQVYEPRHFLDLERLIARSKQRTREEGKGPISPRERRAGPPGRT
ncbi:MAG: PilZ domain-containing protein [Bryobacteraceae bacterium]